MAVLEGGNVLHHVKSDGESGENVPGNISRGKFPNPNGKAEKAELAEATKLMTGQFRHGHRLT